MRSTCKRIFAAIMSVMFMMGIPMSLSAQAPELELTLPQITAVVSVTNVETGDTQHFYHSLNSDEIELTQISTRNGETHMSFNANVAADFDFSGDTPNVTIVPLGSQANWVISGGMRAEVGILASSRMQGHTTEINVSNFFGSWTSTNPALFYVINRRATLALALVGPHRVNLLPTTNSFSHSPNWGWAVQGFNGGASSEATVRVSSMEGSHNIFVGFVFD